MNIAETLDWATNQLKSAGIQTARLDALVLLGKISKANREWILAHPEHLLNKDTLAKYQKLISQRKKRIPVSQLIGKQEFWGLEFVINKNVLAPRPESEKIVEFALSYTAKQATVLDVGTGCGALAIAIAKERPNWRVTASELSSEALSVAKANVKKHDAAVTCKHSDLLTNIQGSFDIVVANLPYLKKGSELTKEASREPDIALFGGKDGLDLYRLFFAQLPPHLKKESLVVIESDPWQQPALIELAASIGLKLKFQDRFVLSFVS